MLKPPLPQTILTAISMIRDDKGQTPPVVHQFLVELLAFNDNLGNPVGWTACCRTTAVDLTLPLSTVLRHLLHYVHHERTWTLTRCCCAA